MGVFEPLQQIFLDTNDAEEFIELDASIHFYKQLSQSIKKPLKMILLYGRPGTGKSMLLRKLYNDLRQQQELFLIDTPIIDERLFVHTLFAYITNRSPDRPISYNYLVKKCQVLKEKRTITVLLDEAQLYPSATMEKIRLLADTRAIKFVVSLHKTDQEDLIAKEHFQSRIWETIELQSATPDDILLYIQKKLIRHNQPDVAKFFNLKVARFIHRLTQGNYREINKLLYALFEIYDYYASHRPSRISADRVPHRFIEMAALKVGLLHA